MNYLLEGEHSERLLFRKLVDSDFNSWLPFHQDPRTSGKWIGEPIDPKIACREWFSKANYRYKNNLGGLNALVDCKTGEFIGQCGLIVQTVDGNKELEIGYSILPIHWNKGYATEAAKKCMTYAFQNRLANSLISIIHIDNTSSIQVAIKLGMYKDKTTEYQNNPVHIYRVSP